MTSVPDRSGDNGRTIDSDPRTVNRVEDFDPTNIVHQGIAHSHERGDNAHITISGGKIYTPVQPGMETPVPKSKDQKWWSKEHTTPYVSPVEKKKKAAKKAAATPKPKKYWEGTKTASTMTPEAKQAWMKKNGLI